MKRSDFKTVLNRAEQLQIWMHLFLLDGLSMHLTHIEREAHQKKFTAETADSMQILSCSIEEIVKKLPRQE